MVWIGSAAKIISKYRDAELLLAVRYARAIGFAHGIPEALEAGRLVTSLRVTGPVAVKVATRAGETLSRAGEIGRSLSLGSSSRMVLDAGRDAVRLGAVDDDRVRGWRRVGVGECKFCQMLIGRGAVYTEKTVAFESHDRCNCVPEYVPA